MGSPEGDASEASEKGQTVFAGSYLAEAYVECGGLPPLFAVRACPDVLPARRTCDAGGKARNLTSERMWMPPKQSLRRLPVPPAADPPPQ